MKLRTPALQAAVLLALSPITYAEDTPPPTRLQEAGQLAAKGDMEGAIKILKAEAEAGNAEAANGLGEIILGSKSKNNRVEALVWFQKAAEQSNPAGMFNAALILYQGGEGITKDEDRGMFLLKASAEAGYAQAQYQLGNLLDAEATKNDKPAGYADAIVWYEKAALQNHAAALYTVSRYYELGMGGKPQDLLQSTDYCGRAARAGSVIALNEFGVRLQKGQGIAKDEIAASGYLHLAAQYGMAAAQTNLGNAYEAGIGVRQDYNQAGVYYAAAAKQNFAAAEFLLAQMFERGMGTDVNYSKAYILYGRAAAGKIEDAAKRMEAIKPKLTENEITAAEKAIAEETKKLQPAEKPADKPAAAPEKPKDGAEK